MQAAGFDETARHRHRCRWYGQQFAAIRAIVAPLARRLVETGLGQKLVGDLLSGFLHRSCSRPRPTPRPLRVPCGRDVRLELLHSHRDLAELRVTKLGQPVHRIGASERTDAVAQRVHERLDGAPCGSLWPLVKLVPRSLKRDIVGH